MALQRCLQKEGASEEKLAKVQSLLHCCDNLLKKKSTDMMPGSAIVLVICLTGIYFFCSL